jgi:hypothetical protein
MNDISGPDNLQNGMLLLAIISSAEITRMNFLTVTFCVWKCILIVAEECHILIEKLLRLDVWVIYGSRNKYLHYAYGNKCFVYNFLMQLN